MEFAIWLIRFGVAITMIVYGIHQLYKPEEWFKYLPNWLNNISPIPKDLEIRLHAIGNLILGLWFLSGIFPLAAGFLTLVWWLTILPTVWKVDWHSFYRDITIIFSICAYIAMLIN